MKGDLSPEWGFLTASLPPESTQAVSALWAAVEE